VATRSFLTGIQVNFLPGGIARDPARVWQSPRVAIIRASCRNVGRNKRQRAAQAAGDPHVGQTSGLAASAPPPV
jgi:hypothetical protein